jgi:hypothetical protein
MRTLKPRVPQDVIHCEHQVSRCTGSSYYVVRTRHGYGNTMFQSTALPKDVHPVLADAGGVPFTSGDVYILGLDAEVWAGC